MASKVGQGLVAAATPPVQVIARRHRKGPPAPPALFSLFLGENYNCTLRRRKAFEITDTELRVMATAATTGLSNNPKIG